VRESRRASRDTDIEPSGPRRLARLATRALIAEAELTPKPALVDRRGSGAHRDLTLASMRRSAHAIEPFFAEMAEAAASAPEQQPTRALREQLAEIGRRAERAMLDATGGSNAHRGAIWALGLLTASASLERTSHASHASRTSQTSPRLHATINPVDAPGVRARDSVRRIARTAAAIAAFPDRAAPTRVSHGLLVERAYGVSGARGEAQRGFPHVIDVALPMLHRRLREGCADDVARLDALLAIMSRLDDTCLLHRGGPAALAAAQRGAQAALRAGGTATEAGMRQLLALDATLLRLNASPGGSADLLSAALFLDAVETETRPAGAHLECEAYGND
jgi:triphosphoribosyl-dephospho-CoA synthase